MSAKTVESLSPINRGVGNQSAFTDQRSDPRTAVLEEAAQHFLTQAPDAVKRRKYNLLNRVVEGGTERVFLSPDPLSHLFRSRWVLALLGFAVGLLTAELGAVMRGQQRPAYSSLRFMALQVEPPMVLNPILDKPVFVLLKDGCQVQELGQTEIWNGTSVVTFQDSGPYFNGWAVRRRMQRVSPENNASVVATTAENESGGNSQADKHLNLWQAHRDRPALHKGQLTPTVTDSFTQQGDGHDLSPLGAQVSIESEVKLVAFYLEAKTGNQTWVPVASSTWRFNQFLQPVFLHGPRLPDQHERRHGHLDLDMRPPLGCWLYRAAARALRLALLVASGTLVVAGRGQKGQQMVLASFLLPGMLELLAAALSLNGWDWLSPTASGLFDVALFSALAWRPQLAAQAAVCGVVLVLWAITESALSAPDPLSVLCDVPCSTLLVVVLGVVGQVHRAMATAAANHAMATDRARYDEVWQHFCEVGSDFESIMELRQTLLVLQELAGGETARHLLHKEFVAPLATSSEKDSREQWLWQRKGAIDSEDEKIVHVTDIDQVFHQARALNPLFRAKVYEWARETNSMLPVARDKPTSSEGSSRSALSSLGDSERSRCSQAETPSGHTSESDQESLSSVVVAKADDDATKKDEEEEEEEEEEEGRWVDAGCFDSMEEVSWEPLKEVDRAIEKVHRCYDDDASRLVDVCRQRIVVRSVEDMVRCVEVIATDTEVLVRGVKDRMTTPVASKRGGGFRAVILYVSVATPAASPIWLHVCELQIVLLPIAIVQAAADHRSYILFRNTRDTSLISSLRQGLSSPSDDAARFITALHRADTTPGRAALMATSFNLGKSSGASQRRRTGRRGRWAAASLGRRSLDEPSRPDADDEESQRSRKPPRRLPFAVPTSIELLNSPRRQWGSLSRAGQAVGRMRRASSGSDPELLSRLRSDSDPDLSFPDRLQVLISAQHLRSQQFSQLRASTRSNSHVHSRRRSSVVSVSEAALPPALRQRRIGNECELPTLQVDVINAIGDRKLQLPPPAVDHSIQRGGNESEAQVQHQAEAAVDAIDQALEGLFAKAMTNPGGTLDAIVQKSSREVMRHANLVSGFFSSLPLACTVGFPSVQVALTCIAALYALGAVLPVVYHADTGARRISSLKLEAFDSAGRRVMGNTSAWDANLLWNGCESWRAGNRTAAARDGAVVVRWGEDTEMNGWHTTVPATSGVARLAAWGQLGGSSGGEPHWECLLHRSVIRAAGGACVVDVEREPMVAVRQGPNLLLKMDLRPPSADALWAAVLVVHAVEMASVAACGVLRKERLAIWTAVLWQAAAGALLLAAGLVHGGSADADDLSTWWVLHGMLLSCCALANALQRQSLVAVRGVVCLLSASLIAGRYAHDMPRTRWMVAALLGDASTVAGCLGLYLMRQRVKWRSRQLLCQDKAHYDRCFHDIQREPGAAAALDSLKHTIASLHFDAQAPPRQRVPNRASGSFLKSTPASASSASSNIVDLLGAGEVRLAVRLATGEEPAEFHSPLLSLDQLYFQAEVLHGMLKTTVQRWAGHSNALAKLSDGSFVPWKKVEGDPEMRRKCKWSRLKKGQRAIEKQLRNYGGNPSRLVDVCRQALVFDSVRDLEACVCLIAADPTCRLVRVKNRLDPRYNAAFSVGYRDVAINLRIVTPVTERLSLEHHVCEVQLILAPFAKLKSEEGHKRYVQFRNARAE